MADGVFNIAKGKVAEYAQRVVDNDPTNSALIVVLAEGAATDATIKDYDTLSALLGDAGVTEASASGYARKVVTTASITPDDTNDRLDVDIADQTWAAVASGNTITRLFICYDNDTTAGTDANIVPLTYHDFSVVTDGSDITATITNFFRAS